MGEQGRELPEGLVCYRKTPRFDQDSVPSALLRRHNTKAGVWGRLVVDAGVLVYCEEGKAAIRVEAPGVVIIAPEVWHHVELDGEMSFHVEFHRAEPG